MSLIPIDKQYEALLAKKAREANKSKGDILNTILQRATQGGELQGVSSPQEMAKALSSVPASRPGSLAEEIQEMAKSMFLMNMMRMMAPQAQASQPQKTMDFDRLFMMRELTKPSMYEIMMMEKIGKGEATPKWLEEMAKDQKETRELLREAVGLKREEERMNNVVAPLVEQMTKDREAMAANQAQILDYIAKGEGAGTGTLEGAIAEALKTRLVEEAMDAIDRGLFKKQEVMTVEGQFNWKGILDRMLNIGEELVKKMPRRAPPVQLIRRTDGLYVNPATGQVLTPAQAAQLGAPMQPPTAQPPAAPPAAMPPPGQPPTTEEEVIKQKSDETIDTFMQTGEEEAGEEQTEEAVEESAEPTGEEQY